MKTLIIFLGIILPTAVSCQSHDSGTAQNKKNKVKPIEEVTVNKKYDDNGNLIEFDSTYTSYYSNFKGDTLFRDSIINNFKTYFKNKFPQIALNGLGTIDSTTFSNHFFHDDYFEKQFFDQNEQLLKMIQEMDSIKNIFFKQNNQLKVEQNM